VDAAVAQHLAGDHAGAEGAFRRLLAEGERHGDRNLQRFASADLAATLIAQGRTAEAEPHLVRAVKLAQAIRNPRAGAVSLYNLAWNAFLRRDFDSAGQLCGAARAAVKGSPPFDLGLVLSLMEGRLATRVGNFELARAALADAARRAQTATDKDLANQVRMAQGILEYRAGRRAGLDLVLAGATKVTVPNRQDLAARWLTGLAHLAAAGGDQDAAARLVSAAGPLHHAPDFPTREQCASYLRA
jgi:tetratricopeptide (TPR) repeat protein